jgi:hypothetical protein
VRVTADSSVVLPRAEMSSIMSMAGEIIFGGNESNPQSIKIDDAYFDFRVEAQLQRSEFLLLMALDGLALC